MKDIHDCECEVITLHGCYRIQYGVQLMRQNISYSLLNSFKRFWEVWGNILRGGVGDHNIKRKYEAELELPEGWGWGSNKNKTLNKFD